MSKPKFYLIAEPRMLDQRLRFVHYDRAADEYYLWPKRTGAKSWSSQERADAVLFKIARQLAEPLRIHPVKRRA